MARKSRKPGITEIGTLVKAVVSVPAHIYSRISHDSDHAEDSIENQITICKEYINADKELILADIFTDLGFSGTDFERPAYSEMMVGILSGEVKCIVVKDAYVKHKLNFFSPIISYPFPSSHGRVFYFLPLCILCKQAARNILAACFRKTRLSAM